MFRQVYCRRINGTVVTFSGDNIFFSYFQVVYVQASSVRFSTESSRFRCLFLSLWSVCVMSACCRFACIIIYARLILDVAFVHIVLLDDWFRMVWVNFSEKWPKYSASKDVIKENWS